MQFRVTYADPATGQPDHTVTVAATDIDQAAVRAVQNCGGPAYVVRVEQADTFPSEAEVLDEQYRDPETGAALPWHGVPTSVTLTGSQWSTVRACLTELSGLRTRESRRGNLRAWTRSVKRSQAAAIDKLVAAITEQRQAAKAEWDAHSPAGAAAEQARRKVEEERIEAELQELAPFIAEIATEAAKGLKS